MEVLEGGFLAHPHGGDLALLHLGLAADAYDVSVAYRGRHTVAVAGQGKIRVPRGGHPDIALDVLLGGDGGAAGDGADQRHLHHGGQRLKARGTGAGRVQPQQSGGSGLQRLRQLLHFGLGQIVDAFFQLGDGGTGAVAHAPGKLLLRKTQLLPAQTDTGGQIRHDSSPENYVLWCTIQCSALSIAKNFLKINNYRAFWKL